MPPVKHKKTPVRKASLAAPDTTTIELADRLRSRTQEKLPELIDSLQDMFDLAHQDLFALIAEAEKLRFGVPAERIVALVCHVAARSISRRFPRWVACGRRLGEGSRARDRASR